MIDRTYSILKRNTHFASTLSMLKSNKVLSIIDQALISGGTFLISYLAALKLGKYEFGLFALLISISNYTYTFHTAIVTQPYVIAVNSEIKIHLIKTGNVATFFLLSIFSTGFLIYCGFFNRLDLSLVINFVLYCYLYAFHEFFRRILQSDLKFRFLVVADVLAYLLRAVIIAGLLIIKNVSNIYSLFLISNIFYSVSILFIFYKSGIYKHFNEGRLIYNELFKEGKWLLGNSLVIFFSSQMYVFFLAHYSGVQAVGIYVAMLMPLGLLRPVFMSAEAYLLPHLTKISRQKRKITFLKEGAFFYIPILALLIAMTVFPFFFLDVFYGNKFRNEQRLFSLASISTILSMSLSFISFYLRIEFKVSLLLKYSVIALICILPWGWWLTKEYGVCGILLITIMNNCFILLQLLKSHIK